MTSRPANGPPTAKLPPSPPIQASGKFGGNDLDEFVAPPVEAPPARFAKPVGSFLATSTKLTGQAPKAAPASPPKPAAPPAKKAAAPSAKAGPSKSLAISPSEPVKYRYSNDDALAQATDLVPGNFQTQLADGAWKVRLEAAEEMIKWVEEEGADKVDSEILIRFLGKFPSWNEKNFQVSYIEIVAAAANHRSLPKYSRSYRF
jgi:cytoskeleton-associated protein 5